MASGSWWIIWVWSAGSECLVGVVVRRYINFLILLIPTPLLSALFCSSIPTFCKCFSFLFQYIFVIYLIIFFAEYKQT